jgi:hypothetical protein
MCEKKSFTVLGWLTEGLARSSSDFYYFARVIVTMTQRPKDDSSTTEDFLIKKFFISTLKVIIWRPGGSDPPSLLIDNGCWPESIKLDFVSSIAAVFSRTFNCFVLPRREAIERIDTRTAASSGQRFSYVIITSKGKLKSDSQVCINYTSTPFLQLDKHSLKFPNDSREK